jgi:hypothetical protein
MAQADFTGKTTAHEGYGWQRPGLNCSRASANSHWYLVHFLCSTVRMRTTHADISELKEGADAAG